MLLCCFNCPDCGRYNTAYCQGDDLFIGKCQECGGYFNVWIYKDHRGHVRQRVEKMKRQLELFKT